MSDSPCVKKQKTETTSEISELIPYLNFNGNCRTVMNFYVNVFHAEEPVVRTYGECPVDSDATTEAKILHAVVKFGNLSIMMCDHPESASLIVGNNVNLSLSINNETEALRVFTELSAGGEVKMPFAKQFWGDFFGLCVDQFGVHWMVNCHPSAPAADDAAAPAAAEESK